MTKLVVSLDPEGHRDRALNRSVQVNVISEGEMSPLRDLGVSIHMIRY